MGAALNGMSLSNLLRPFGGTFLVFSDYMRGAVRLAAIMQTGVTFVWTHDSIGLGEDGPTHQPVEHLWALRAIPGLDVVRPADANETSVVWGEILRKRRPTGLALTRQNLPTVDRTVVAPAAGAAKGGYVLADASTGSPDVVLLATGSEVQLALAARDVLEADGVAARVVSLPCVEWFEEQDAAYRESVLPSSVRARVSVEAGIALGWWKYLGTDGRAVSLEHFGASADAATLFREFGITTEAVVAAARESIAAAGA
jgi:transketolase